MKPRRRQKNYIKMVEGELFGLWREAKDLSSAAAEVTNTDMYGVMIRAERALKALGWELNSKPGHAPAHSE